MRQILENLALAKLKDSNEVMRANINHPLGIKEDANYVVSLILLRLLSYHKTASYLTSSFISKNKDGR
jgi:hypothetical protein